MCGPCLSCRFWRHQRRVARQGVIEPSAANQRAVSRQPSAVSVSVSVSRQPSAVSRQPSASAVSVSRQPSASAVSRQPSAVSRQRQRQPSAVSRQRRSQCQWCHLRALKGEHLVWRGSLPVTYGVWRYAEVSASAWILVWLRRYFNLGIVWEEAGFRVRLRYRETYFVGLVWFIRSVAISLFSGLSCLFCRCGVVCLGLPGLFGLFDLSGLPGLSVLGLSVSRSRSLWESAICIPSCSWVCWIIPTA